MKDGSEYADPSTRRATITVPSLSDDLDLFLADLAGDSSAEAEAGGVLARVAEGTEAASA